MNDPIRALCVELLEAWKHGLGPLATAPEMARPYPALPTTTENTDD